MKLFTWCFSPFEGRKFCLLQLHSICQWKGRGPRRQISRWLSDRRHCKLFILKLYLQCFLFSLRAWALVGLLSYIIIFENACNFRTGSILKFIDIFNLLDSIDLNQTILFYYVHFKNCKWADIMKMRKTIIMLVLKRYIQAF